MDRDKHRPFLWPITDEEARTRETSRIEAEYHLDTAVAHLGIAVTGKLMDAGARVRIVSAIQGMIYNSSPNPSPEEAMRREYAQRELDAETKALGAARSS